MYSLKAKQKLSLLVLVFKKKSNIVHVKIYMLYIIYNIIYIYMYNNLLRANIGIELPFYFRYVDDIVISGWYMDNIISGWYVDDIIIY